MQIKNSVAVITGAASGLGKAVSDLLLEMGAKVARLDRAFCAKSVSSSQEILIPVDVADEADANKAIKAILENFGKIDICINCAGMAPAAKTIDKQGRAAELFPFTSTVAVNLIGTFNIARLCAEQMQHNPVNENQERGVIINTASIAAYDGQQGQTAYAASKGGVVSMTLPMARDLASLGIRVNTIAPGVMQTPMMDAMPEKVQTGLAENIPFPKRFGKPTEFSALAKHIIENPYINGEVIRLDGALRMQ